MLNNVMNWFFGFMLFFVLFPLSACAAEASNPAFVAAPLGITLAIAYVTRRMAIGGWLFYYYLQLYIGVLLTIAFIPAIVNNLQPTGWEDKTIYGFFVFSIVPPLLVKVLEVIFATRLLFKSQRNEKNVKTVRYVLLSSVIFSIISLVIDGYYFRENAGLSIYAVIFASIWCLYFFYSYRVDYVLSRRTDPWNYDNFKKSKAVLAKKDVTVEVDTIREEMSPDLMKKLFPPEPEDSCQNMSTEKKKGPRENP
ncbi:MAG: hypothetical protein JW902_11305 [Syntrophaceae bacterium]|nr:hypothetical protein [Syntrophaceae bacterium]